jgi:hypothetical protein
VGTAELAAVDTEPIDVPVREASHDDGDAIPVQMASRDDSPRFTTPRAARHKDDVEDAVAPVQSAPHTDHSQRPQPIEEQRLAPLFSPGVAQDLRARWDATQIGFVDDPRQAVKQADELVAHTMQSLAKSFADERTRLEAQMNETASTENLRVALQRYRSFFQRLLSL